jgi:exodeoxyribonuclease III
VKIATYNVNGINGRLPVLLRWLAEDRPDIVCLQELKAPDEKFPRSALRDLGYDAIWQGQKSWNGVAILSRVGEIHETRRGLPGEPDDVQSRYLEAAVNGVLIGGLYLPNGNPRPGPKFAYKRRWFERLTAHAGSTTRCSRRRFERPFSGSSRRGGPMRCARSIPTRPSTPSGSIFAAPSNAMTACGSITFC